MEGESMNEEIELPSNDVTINVGSHHKIRINKLYGPVCVPDLMIVWEGNDWNVRTINRNLRKQNRSLKQEHAKWKKEFIKRLKEEWENGYEFRKTIQEGINFIDKLAGERLI
jgi:hypothetical protein